MSKITLEFDAETEHRQALRALHALDYYCALCDIAAIIRAYNKYDNEKSRKKERQLLAKVLEVAWDAQHLGEE